MMFWYSCHIVDLGRPGGLSDVFRFRGSRIHEPTESLCSGNRAILRVGYPRFNNPGGLWFHGGA